MRELDGCDVAFDVKGISRDLSQGRGTAVDSDMRNSRTPIYSDGASERQLVGVPDHLAASGTDWWVSWEEPREDTHLLGWPRASGNWWVSPITVVHYSMISRLPARIDVLEGKT
jgi:hypothetical protein